ncbi:MAG: V-type ATP synthase subunit I [Thermoplasmata archaeon]
MLRPRRMSRVVVAGPRERMRSVVETLHAQRSMHITDYREEYEGFVIGTPMEGSAESSERLLRLRAASKILGVEEGPTHNPLPSATARKKLDALLSNLEREVRGLEAERQELESGLRELEKRRASLLSFAELPLPLKAYRPYDSLAVFTGKARAGFERELERVTDRFELFTRGPEGPFALFVDKSKREEVERVLARHDFTELRAPEGEGYPSRILAALEREIEQKRERLEAVKRRLALAREEYRDEILACSEELAIEIEKAEAPLRFATTDTAFVIEGWVPTDELERTAEALRRAAGDHIHIEALEEEEWLEEARGTTERAEGKKDAIGAKGQGRKVERGEGEDDIYAGVPVALKNPRPFRPFEALIELFSLPSYKELDPTVLLALVFPFFFGLMIGDLGYGALLIATGLIFRTKLKKWEGFSELGAYILAAGLFASIFGALVFAEAFGVPFHSAAHGEGGGEVSWESLTGLDIPVQASIHKLEASGLSTLMVFSVVAGSVHLCLGHLLGAVTEWQHSRRRAAGKVGWFMIVFGFGLIILKFADKNSLGAWLWAGPLAPFSAYWDPGIGLLIPYASVASLVPGVALAAIGEGPLALMEVFSALSNILSYTRLAAIGVAKGAMAFAFNSILLPLVTGGSIGLALAGWALLILAHMLVFVLGSISSGIQALRLNYVEFFTKFYKGGGIKFRPFGYWRRYTTET